MDHYRLGRRAVWPAMAERDVGPSVGRVIDETELGARTSPTINASDVLLIPLGSTEQHGPHLPLDTDSRIARAIATGAAAVTAGSTVAPVLAYGASGEHAGFPGTLSIGTDALTTIVVELVRSATQTFRSIVLVNGHGGNHEGVTVAVARLTAEGHDVRCWSPSVPSGDAHAGRTETSLMLAIAPDSVDLSAAEPGNTTSVRELMPQMRVGGVAAVSPNGVLGDPADASAAEGRELLQTLVADLARTIQSPGATA